MAALEEATSLSFSDSKKIAEREKRINDLNKEITSFMIKLSDEELSAADKRFIADAFHTVSDIERIGDYAENIAEYAEKLREYRQSFSSESLSEIESLRQTLENMFSITVNIYEHNDASLIPELYTHEQNADDLKKRWATTT